MAKKPLLNRPELDRLFGDRPLPTMPEIGNVPYRGLNLPDPSNINNPSISPLTNLENELLSIRPETGQLTGGSIMRTLKDLKSDRYDVYVPGDYNNEDAYAQGQGWTSKMMNGVGKGLVLTGTTFLQSTLGLVNGVARASIDGRAASFYDNEFNRALDELNKNLENTLPNYYTDVEKNSRWYSPSKLFSANFFWDGIIKNMGFAAGTILSGAVYTKALSSLPLASRLFSVGKAAEALAATEEGLLAANKVAETYGKIRSLSDKFTTTYNLLNPGGRALVAGLATTGEAGFEAYHNLNQFRDEKIQEYKNTHNGLEPRGEDLDNINRLADEVGNSSYMLNVGLLTATNYIQLPKILGSSYSAEKGIVNSLAKETGEIIQEGGKFLAKTPKNRLLSTINKIRPYTFSASEGFEEGAQYAITVGTQDYYNKKYDGDAADFIESLSQGITQTLTTDEGMENVLIGGLSGALMMARGKFLDTAQKNRNTATAVQAFNQYKLTDFTKETIDSVNRGTVLQKERETAIRQGDILESKDLEADYVINYLTPRIKYGRFDLVKADIDDLRKLAMTPEGFAQLQAEGKALQTDTQSAYLDRLSNFEITANNIQSLYQSLQLRYGNLVTKEGNLVYNESVINKMIYSASKVADYDQRIPQLSESLVSSGIIVSDVIDDVIKGNSQKYNEAVKQIQTLNVNSDIKESLLENLSDVSEIALRRQQFLKEYDDIKNNPKFYEKDVVYTEEGIEAEVEKGDYEKVENLVNSIIEGTYKNTKENKDLRKSYSKLVDKLITEATKNIQEDRFYLAPDIEKAHVHKASDNEWQVKVGTDIVSSFSNEEEAESERDNLNTSIQNRSQIKVLKVNPEGTITAQNLEGEVITLSPKQVLDYDLVLTEEEKKQRKESFELAQNQALLEKYTSTLTTETETVSGDTEFEPEKKKDNNAVVNGTIPIDDEKPHQQRANTFGINYHKFDNKKKEKLKIVEITSKTEEKAGIKGLISYLLQGTDIDPNTVVVGAVVKEGKKGKFQFVDENGEPTTEDLINRVIYQVRPTTEKLDDMFRKSTSEEVKKQLTASYKKERERILSNTELEPLKDFDVSFGHPILEQKSDEEGNLVNNYDAKVSVEDADLVTKDLLEKTPVITVATTNTTLTEGNTSYTSPLGRVFLRIPGVGLTKLNNSKLGSEKANTVYEAILQLSKNAQEDPENGVKNSSDIVNWLKSVVYWGIPKNKAGYNSVWFETVKDPNLKGVFNQVTNLFISGKGESFNFTPANIENNKATIITLLENLYHHTSATEVNPEKPLKEYREITGFTKEGQPIFKNWPNYQTYLLSGEGRKNEEIPLTTNILSVKGTDKQNRQGLYFILKDNIDATVAPTNPPNSTPKPVTTEVVLDGKTSNIYKAPSGAILKFKATTEALTDPSKIEVLQGADETKVLNTLIEKLGTKEKAVANIKNTIYLYIKDKYKPEVDEFEQEHAIGGEELEEAPPSKLFQKAAKIEVDAPQGFFTLNKKSTTPDAEVYRQILAKQAKQFEGENWQKVEEWLKDNFPNIPVYRVKNIIQATNGKQAWGMFHNGAIYLYQNAEVGTIYHEVFEGVWKMFTDAKEQQSILDEFRGRKGSFEDKFTGKEVKYSEATYQEAKEQLAEEFRDYVLNPKKEKSAIGKFFTDLYNFIKEFFTGEKAQTNTEELFKRIGEGYYKTFIPYESNLSFAKTGFIDIDSVYGDANSEYRITSLPYTQVHEIMQHMTYATLTDLIKTNKSLFEVEKGINKDALYNRLKKEILTGDENTYSLIEYQASLVEKNFEDKIITKQQRDKQIVALENLYLNVQNEWPNLVAKHTEYLRQYNIQFDENNELHLNDENAAKTDETYTDSRKVDSFKKSNPAIKMLLATLPERQFVDNELPIKRSSIGGVTTLPLDKVFITLKNQLYNSRNVEEMLDKLREFSIENPNYRALYSRLTKQSTNLTVPDQVDLSGLTSEYDIQLLSAFYKSMRAQNADVKIVFILPSGEVEVGDAHLSNATRQVKFELFNDVVGKLRGGTDLVTYNKSKKEYIATDKLKKYVLMPSNLETYRNFLKAVGIEFTKQEVNKLTRNQKDAFIKATEGVKQSLSELSGVKDLNKKTINLDKRLSQLGAVKAALTNPDFESVYFNINGERTQTYIGTNSVSNFYDYFSKLDNIKDLENTPFRFLTKDNFFKGSALINHTFTSNGSKKDNTEDILTTGIVEGYVNEVKGKRKESSQLTLKERVLQELNLNSKGWFLNLVPGDASIEWMVKMYHESNPFITQSNPDKILDIFKNYFISEVEVSRENRDIVKVGDRKSTDLRFFKGVLDKVTHDKIVKDKKSTPEELYNSNKSTIDKAVKKLISDKSKQTLDNLKRYGIVSYNEDGLNVDGLEFVEKGITEENLNKTIDALTANFIVSNIELHKLIYSDPYFYKDELKRIKNFNSPGQSLVSNSEQFNNAANQAYNKGYEIDDLGHTDFHSDALVSTVSQDVKSTLQELGYEPFDETDGGGIITMKANRHLRIRAANWNSDEERQYRYDIAWEKQDKGLDLTKEEKELLKKNPDIKSAYTPLKPIVRGSKLDGKNYNDIVLDKFALVPYSYRILKEINPDSNALKLYNKMNNEGVDYIVYDSGRKVSLTKPTPLYNEEDSFNTEPFVETNTIPFSIIDIQTDVPSKESPEVTQGSQVTKLVTMDFMDAGVPLDYQSDRDFNDRFVNWSKLTEAQRLKQSPLYKEIKNNETLLVERIKHGFNTLLDRLGITKENNNFVIEDSQKLADTLKDEIFKREVNDNIIAAFSGFKSGDVVLEATPAYQQIRNILYSIANKQVTRPTITGGLKVQIPQTLLESVKAKATKVNNKVVYEADDNVLSFYKDEDGKRVCEIMVGRWFDSDKSDHELLDFFNKTEEGKKILSGIAFRIPTQKQNSIDAFRIKQFLPREFGDSVVIPSALVKKVGSDFDIDKLSLYLKNTYENEKGNIKLLPFYGFGQQAIDKFEDLYLDNKELTIIELNKKLEKQSKQSNLFGDLALGLTSVKVANKWIPIYSEWFRDEITEEGKIPVERIEQIFISRIEKLNKKIDKLTDDDAQEVLAKEVAERWYKKSLENEYVQSMENLVSHPLNFEKLVKPNSAEQLKDLTKEILKLRGQEDYDYAQTSNLLDREFMSSLRQAFVRGKYAIGIAATSQTNNAQNQRTNIFINTDKLDSQSEDDKKWLGDGEIKFKEYNKIFIEGKDRPTMSLSKNAKGQLISDIIGQFIDGYVDISKGPWIMQLGATPNTASTWLFLIKLGVPIDTVAYFMNQPIVVDYLKQLENEGYTYLFNSTINDSIREGYESNASIKKDTLPSESKLKNSIGKKTSEMSQEEKAQQLFILEEFLKYAKLSEQQFHVQQGSNFDTATINDPFIAFKKEMQYLKAKTVLIDGVDKLLENSFVGDLKDIIGDVRNAYSTILISDKPNVRKVLEQVLLPYVDTQDREFVKISQKAVSDLFDWAVQTNDKLNTRIQDILLGSENTQAAAKEITDFVESIKADKNHPLSGNYIINSLKQQHDSTRENTPYNLYIAGKSNKTYDQNSVIYGFNELKQTIPNSLYRKIIGVSILQSGLSNSKISFSNLLPYEDFKEIYNETLSQLEKFSNLQDFVNLNVLQRNNWASDDIVSNSRAITRKSKKGNWLYNLPMMFIDKNLKKATSKGQLPQLLNFAPFTKEGREDFINYSWEKTTELLEGEYIPSRGAQFNRIKQIKAEMRKKGDFSFIQKGLFKKVYGSDGKPLIQKSEYQGVEYQSYVYRAINAWGDSYRANEFYNYPNQSVIDNGFIKVDPKLDNTGTDAIIENILYPNLKKDKKVKDQSTSQIPKCL